MVALREVTGAKEQITCALRTSIRRATKSNRTIPEAYDTRGARRRALEATFPLNDLPNDLLVSFFETAQENYKDTSWARRTFPLVNKVWAELYCTKNASPLHETLQVDFCATLSFNAARVISWIERRAGSVHKPILVVRLGVGERERVQKREEGRG